MFRNPYSPLHLSRFLLLTGKIIIDKKNIITQSFAYCNKESGGSVHPAYFFKYLIKSPSNLVNSPAKRFFFWYLSYLNYRTSHN